MAQVPMIRAEAEQVASASANNLIIDNVEDLAGRMNTVEDLTGQGGTTGVGNYTLDTRLGPGVTTTNTATAQLNDLSSRAGSLETTVDNPATLGSGNDAMNARITALETASGGVVPYFHGYASAGQAVNGSAAYVPIALAQETVDTVGGHSGASFNSRYKPGINGWYECIGMVLFNEGPAAYVANQVGARIRVNGGNIATGPLGGYFPTPDQNSNILCSVFCFAMVEITDAEDYIELAGIASYNTATVAGSFLRVRKVA